MDKATSDPLLAIGKVVVIIGQALMGLAATALAIAIPIVLVLQERAQSDLRAELDNPDFIFPTMAIVGLFLLMLAVIVLAFLFFDRLRRIVNTVGEGDPFAPQNAERLTAMAWFMLAIQILAVPTFAVGMYVTEIMDGADATVDASFDLSGIVMVIVLFILARVFRHGAAMRADLEGTV